MHQGAPGEEPQHVTVNTVIIVIFLRLIYSIISQHLFSNLLL